MSWRFVLTPKWIVRHVAVLALVLAMIWLAFWQLQRLDDKRAYKALVEARQEQAIVDVESIVESAAQVDDEVIDDVLYRAVRARGMYAAEDTVVVENRTYNAAPGGWVLTPLVLGDGTAVVVNRGFVGFDRTGEIVAPRPPSGVVTVEGLVFPSQRRGSFGPQDAPGDLTVLARVDLDRIEAQVDYEVLPAYLQLASSRPPEPQREVGAAELVALGVPEPDEGPHLSYAGQWAIFTLIATGGYGVLLRRVAKEQAAAGRVDG